MSSHYRIINSELDSDAKFNSLPHLAQLIWYRTFNHTLNTSIGAFRAERAGLAEHFKIKMREFTKHFNLLIENNFLKFDFDANLLWFPNFFEHDFPTSINCVKSWSKILPKLPTCELKTLVIQQSALWIQQNKSKAFFDALPQAFRDAIPYAIPDAIPDGKAKASLIQKPEARSQNTNNILILEESTNNVEETPENIEVIALPTMRGRYSITQNDINNYKIDYPSVDVKLELEKMRDWINENPTKTPTSIGRFICKWLKKSQEDGAQIHEFRGRKHASKRTSTDKRSAFEQAMVIGAEWNGSIS
jgi:hypothetical protein